MLDDTASRDDPSTGEGERTAPLVGERWLARVGIATVAAVGLLGWGFYDRMYILPSIVLRRLEPKLDAMVAGTFDAPYQYRVLVPRLLDGLRDAGLTLEEALRLVDGLSLAVAMALGALLFRRHGYGLWLTPGALWLALPVIGIAYYPNLETLPSFAVMSAAFLVLADRRLSPWLLVPLVALLLGMRTDLAGALAAGFALRWWTAGRDRRDLLTATLLVLAAVAATLALMARYPDAHYADDVGAFQLGYNLTGEPWLMTAAAVFLPFVPLLAAQRATIVQRAGPMALPLLAPLAAEVAVTLVVGRLDEVRIFLPLGWGAALGGVMLWRAALLGDGGREPAPAP